MLSPVVLLVYLITIVALIALLLPSRRNEAAYFPVVTLGLLLVNTVVFAANVDGDSLSAEATRTWGMAPRAANILNLITYMFQHGNWKHLLCNMLVLWQFGPNVERALGRLEYLVFYVGCGIAAGLLHLIVAATFFPAIAGTYLVGASGAIFGILGLYGIRFWHTRVWVLRLIPIPAYWAVAFFALFEVFSISAGQEDGTAHWAHLGGLLFGAVMALPLRMREDGQREYQWEDALKAAAAGNNEAAATLYRQVLIRTPDDPEAHHALGRTYIALGQAEAAHRHLLESLNLYLKDGHSLAVARVYEDAVASFQNFPLSPVILQRVASACEESEQFNLAVRALSELCRDHPTAREAEMSLLRLGKLHLQKLNQPQNAEGIFSEFLRLYPTSDWGYHALRLRQEAQNAAQNYRPIPAQIP